MTDPADIRTGETAFQTRLIDRRPLSPGTVEIDLARPDGFSFVAGQRIRLLHGDLSRDYTLTNGPEAPVLTLCVRLVKGGAFSNLLDVAPQNAALSFSGPHGYFVFHASQRPAVWVATGTGIAPFAAMCRSGRRCTVAAHGVRNAEELYYSDLLRIAAGTYAGCLSTEPDAPGDFFHGRVTDYLQHRLTTDAYDFYLCGRREMIRDATLIIDDRFPGSRIYAEIFY
jgi:ferredoxin-NADP reductase